MCGIVSTACGSLEAIRLHAHLRARLAFVFISKLYRQMYASTGIATDSARRSRANRWARWLAVPCRKLFHGALMPALQVPPRRDHEEAVAAEAAVSAFHMIP